MHFSYFIEKALKGCSVVKESGKDTRVSSAECFEECCVWLF